MPITEQVRAWTKPYMAFLEKSVEPGEMRAMASPEVINDSSKYQKTAKAHSELSEIVEKYREYKDLQRGIEESKAMIAEESDAELRAYAQEELTCLEKGTATTENEL